MPKFLEVTNTRSARTALGAASRSVGINVLDYITDYSDTSTHTAGFQAAIQAAIATGGYEIVIPAGQYYVSNVEIPDAPLKFRGHGSVAVAEDVYEGDTRGTFLRRNGSDPIFKALGPARGAGVNPGDNFGEFIRDITFEDITFKNDSAPVTTPLLQMQACTAWHFNRCVFFSGTDGHSLIDMRGVADTRFVDCFFLGGGDEDTGLGAIRMRDGDDEFAAVNAVSFVNCSIENYFGPGLQIGDGSVTTDFRPNLLLFSNLKMESKSTTGPHIVAGRATGIYFANTHIAHWKTAGPIVEFDKVIGAYGDLSFVQIFLTDWVDPSARLDIGANSYNINLDLNLAVGTADDVNVVTQATAAKSIDVRVNGVSQRVNDTTRIARWIEAQTLYLQSQANTCQMVFDKQDLNFWVLGSPTNPSGTVQQFDFKAYDASANVATFLSLKSADTNPVTSQRTVTAHGNLEVTQNAAVTGSATVSGSIELGHASDTTLSRVSAGVVAIEGVNIATTADVPFDLSTGEATMDRREVTATTITGNNQALRLTYFTARRTETVTQVQAMVNVAAVGATLVRFGIYTVAANGDLTLVASTANDATLLDTTGLKTKTLSASLAKTRGTRYAVAVLVDGASTTPQLSGSGTIAGALAEISPRLSGLVTGQSDLPATVSAASVAQAAFQIYVALT